MQSSTFDHPPLAMPVDLHGYTIELDQCDGRATLTLVGDIDAAAADALRGILACMGDLPGPLHVDAGGVLAADVGAFDPLLALARDRHRRHEPGVVMDSLSDTVRDLFQVLGLPAEPPVDLDADRACPEIAS